LCFTQAGHSHTHTHTYTHTHTPHTHNQFKVVNLLRSFFQKNCPFSTNNWWICTKIWGVNLWTVGNKLKIQENLRRGTVRNYACGCENYDVKVGVFYKKSTEWNFEKNSQNTYLDPISLTKNFQEFLIHKSCEKSKIVINSHKFREKWENVKK